MAKRKLFIFCNRLRDYSSIQTLPIDADPLDALVKEALSTVVDADSGWDETNWNDEIAGALVWKSELKN